jgi:hypothetical protein
MFPILVGFKMTDDEIARACKESAQALGRELFTPVMLLLVGVCATIVLLNADRGWDWLLLLMAAPVLLFGLLFAGWLSLLWWLPYVSRRRLTHLPHRGVNLEIGDDRLVFETATERLELDWVELKQVRELRNFWLFCLRSGPQIPVPKPLLSEIAIDSIRGKAGIAA